MCKRMVRQIYTEHIYDTYLQGQEGIDSKRAVANVN